MIKSMSVANTIFLLAATRTPMCFLSCIQFIAEYMYVEVDKDSQQSIRILLQRADALSTQAYYDILL